MEPLTTGMKERQRFNSTTPMHELREFITPTERLFVVHHLGIPDIAAVVDWHIVVNGLVNQPLRLSLSDLAALPQVELTAFHECAGSPLRPEVAVRRAGNVTWGGVRLRTVLERAGVMTGAAFVWARGADSGIYPPTGHANDSYLKDLPLAKGSSEEVLLATTLNGQSLDEQHGAPVRLVVPGFYGTNSVKWLTELIVADKRADGYFTTTLYNDRRIEQGVEVVEPVWEVAPHSVIVAPSAGERLRAGQCLVWGWAWAAAPIASVEISSDAGCTWSTAAVHPRQGHAWQRFEFEWEASTGSKQLQCRATDKAGRTQPASRARNEVLHLTVDVQ